MSETRCKRHQRVFAGVCMDCGWTYEEWKAEQLKRNRHHRKALDGIYLQELKRELDNHALVEAYNLRD